MGYDGLTPPNMLNFGKVAFWVQIHSLALACMNREVGRLVGQSIGEVEDVDIAGDGVDWGRYLCVKNVMDVEQSLARGRTIHLKGKDIWVSLQYEKLPRIFFDCGTTKHGPSGCLLGGSRRLHEVEEDKQFGPWLRAQAPIHRTSSRMAYLGPSSAPMADDDGEPHSRQSSKPVAGGMKASLAEEVGQSHSRQPRNLAAAGGFQPVSLDVDEGEANKIHPTATKQGTVHGSRMGVKTTKGVNRKVVDPLDSNFGEPFWQDGVRLGCELHGRGDRIFFRGEKECF